MGSERLSKLVGDELIRVGMKAMRDASGLNKMTIRTIADRTRTPHWTTAYKAALACGLSHEEALALARECPSRYGRRAA